MFAVVYFDTLAQATVFLSKGNKLYFSAEWSIQSWEVSDINSPADRMPTHNMTELSRIKQKLELNSPKISRQSAVMFLNT